MCVSCDGGGGEQSVTFFWESLSMSMNHSTVASQQTQYGESMLV